MWFIIGFILGYNIYKIRETLNHIKGYFVEEEIDATVITQTPEAEYKPKGKTGLIEPKSPQLIEFEENERLRKQNPGRF